MSFAEGHYVAVGRCTQQRNFTKKAVNIIARTQGYQKDCPMLQQLCATCITQTLSNISITTASSNVETTEHAQYHKNMAPTCVPQGAPLGRFGKHALIKLAQQNLAEQSLSV